MANSDGIQSNEAVYMQFMNKHNKSHGTREEFNFRMNLFMETDARI